MNRAAARAIRDAYPDPSPLHDVYRALRLAQGGYERIAGLLPREGLVVDLGCGEGLLAHVLVAQSSGLRVLSVDHDRARVEHVRASAAGKPIEVAQGDLASFPIPACDAVVLLDVMHYLDLRTQEALVVRAFEALRPGGILLLRDPDAGAGPRFALARLHETIFTRFGITHARIGSFRTSRAWTALLRDAGFADVRAHPLSRSSPYADRIVTGTRAEAPSATADSLGGGAREIGFHDIGNGLLPDVSLSDPTSGPRPCPVCGTRRRRSVLRHPEGVLSRCRGCGLVSVDPLPDAGTALSQYDADYFRGDDGYRNYAAEEAHFRREFRRRLRRVLAAGGRGRLLDVGAATGAFLMEAREAGFETSGIEPASAIADFARARGLSVETASVETASPPEGAFDVVTCFDALEHVVDPVSALRRMRRWAKPDGLLVLTVPDFGGTWARASGAHWPFVTPREHLHYFDRRALRAALRASGWEATTVGLAGTPVSYGSLLRHLGGELGRTLDPLLGPLSDRGRALPFGTLFALARPAEGPAANPPPARR